MNIKDVHTISTKKGDKGSSRNYSNESFSKADRLFETLGTVDELSSVLGLSYHYTQYEQIKQIQTTLQTMNSLIATNQETTKAQYDKLVKIQASDIEALEERAQRLIDEHPIEPKFLLPGSDTTLEGAYFDWARSVCRRAERELVRFIDEKERTDLDLARGYLNRLSDLLFVLARNFNPPRGKNET